MAAQQANKPTKKIKRKPFRSHINPSQKSNSRYQKTGKQSHKQESSEDEEDEDSDNENIEDNDEFISLEEKPKRKLKRLSKHAPQEVSAKKPVPRFREVVEVPKIVRRDPRFESLSGKFDDTQFRKNYRFLNEYREQEIKQLKEQIGKARDPIEVAKLKKECQSLESKHNAAKKKEFEKNVIKEAERAEREQVKQGKKPFYLKKGEPILLFQ